ncbi:MAG: sulfotransferase [Balneolaceae bacterium]|nr:sulfotransferase [Balneolaceae bacterium]
MADITPIFIFSLPRSGSTLLQRIIGASEKVCTTSEPWFLLPIIGSYSNVDMYSEFGHSIYRRAFKDLMDAYPDGLSKYRERIQEFSISVYNDFRTDKSVYFLDKTPRYHLICEEIMSVFPNAKFIFLWRNPEDVMLSIANTWYNSTWTTHPFEVDLKKGLNNLINTYLKNKHKENVLSLCYEDLVNPLKTDLEIKKIENILGINDLKFDTTIDLKGSLGDMPTNNKQRAARKKDIINTLYRKRYVKNILNQFSSDEWQNVGYNLNALLNNLDSRKVYLPISISDIVSILKTMIRKKFITSSESIIY